MGFRFRKRIKIAPGVRLNISKSGVSTSLGVRGASANVGKRGVRATVGIPGSGVSFSESLTNRRGDRAGTGAAGEAYLMTIEESEMAQAAEPSGCMAAIAFGVPAIAAIFILSSSMTFGRGLFLAAGIGVIWIAIVALIGQRMQRHDKEEAKARLESIWNGLAEDYGADDATRIMRGEIRQDDPREYVEIAYGEPDEISERVMKTKTRHVLKYGRINARSFAFKVTIEDGYVVGWED